MLGGLVRLDLGAVFGAPLAATASCQGGNFGLLEARLSPLAHPWDQRWNTYGFDSSFRYPQNSPLWYFGSEKQPCGKELGTCVLSRLYHCLGLHCPILEALLSFQGCWE